MKPTRFSGEKIDFTLKFIVIGDLRVGKTTFINRFVTGRYNANLKPCDGMDSMVKVIGKGDKKILLRLWDTAGQERFRSLTNSHYRDVQGCFILFDLTDTTTFDNVRSWYNDLQSKSDTMPKVILVGTKCHLYRTVHSERAEQLADHLELPYIEISSELGVNVKDAFDTLVELVLVDLKQRSSGIVLSKDTEVKETKEKWKFHCAC